MKALNDMTKAQRAELRVIVRRWLHDAELPEVVTPAAIESLLYDLYAAWPEKEATQ